MSSRVGTLLPDQVRAAAETSLDGEPRAHRVVVLARLEQYWPDLLSGLREAYGPDGERVAARAADVAVAAAVARPEELRLLDLRRQVQTDWFQRPGALGYAAYADRFAGTLRGVAQHVDYLAELGVTYLHLLPLLQPRPRPNDGGYAVADYRQVRADLGTVEDLEALSAELRRHGISLAIDLVLNHVAAEHEWARRARAGERRYRDYFHVYPDRTEPDRFEADLPEVFPDLAPGSFTWDDELAGWVWTTFNTWQWDLNWHNPEVFHEFADLVGYLANLGVECLRLDAIAFIWKRLGTTCQNQPEVHALTRALRAVARIAAPALVFKAEAIVGPSDLLPYLGVGRHTGRVSDLAYHNSLMVQIWSALAAQDTRLTTHALRRFPPKPPNTAWATYLRCHDDIGWAIDDDDARAAAVTGAGHRAFLSDWYGGAFPSSPARGLVFQENAETGDRRISGTAASLAGLEAAGDDPAAVALALNRLVLAHLVILGHGGLPLLWMGDELAMLNDSHWADEPEHADDNRWVHRPRMDWTRAERRHVPGTIEHRMWTALRHAVHVRAGLPALHARVDATLLEPVNPGLLAVYRAHPEQHFLGLYNVTPVMQRWPRASVPWSGEQIDALTRETVEGDAVLPPYGGVWLVDWRSWRTKPSRRQDSGPGRRTADP